MVKTKKILIIGASGYIGARLSYLLSINGYEVTSLCYPEIPDNKEWTSLMKKVIIRDITSVETIEEITSESYEVAIHLVSLDHKKSNDSPRLVNSINVLPGRVSSKTL